MQVYYTIYKCNCKRCRLTGAPTYNNNPLYLPSTSSPSPSAAQTRCLMVWQIWNRSLTEIAFHSTVFLPITHPIQFFLPSTPSRPLFSLFKVSFTLLWPLNTPYTPPNSPPPQSSQLYITPLFLVLLRPSLLQSPIPKSHRCPFQLRFQGGVGFPGFSNMDQERKPLVSNWGAWAMNVSSSVGIIMANKVLMSSVGYGFAFATTLTGFHFATTAFVGWVSSKTRFSSSKQVPLWELLWFSIVANMSITGMNLSLMLNSVGFYQISKLSITPVVCVMEWLLHNKNYSGRVIMAVLIVAFGVGICTVTDVQINGKGFLCACVAVMCTSLQQITIGSFQKKYSIDSFELLSKTAPVQAVSLLMFGPFIDYYLNGRSILDYQFSYGATFFILLSCALAVFCNASQYMCIGRFSAVSFQVLGHMKTVCVLILGWMFFDSALTVKNLSGMALTVGGMVTYSWAMELEKQAKKTTVLPVRNDSFRDEDMKLLKGGAETIFEHGQTKI